MLTVKNVINTGIGGYQTDLTMTNLTCQWDMSLVCHRNIVPSNTKLAAF